MTTQSQSAAAIAAAIAAASLTDKKTHDFIAATCPAVFHRVDTDWQTHNITTERSNGRPDYNAPSAYAIERGNTREDRIEVRREVIFAAIAMQSEIDLGIATSDYGADVAIDNWTPELDASEAIATAKAAAHDVQDAAYIKQGKIADYIAYATMFVMGVAAGLVVAYIAASAILSNLPQ